MREINGVNVLWLLRDGIATDWVSLCHEFGLPHHRMTTLWYALMQVLDNLRSVDLITFEHNDNMNEDVIGAITLSPSWNKIQAALGVSLSEITKLGRGSMIVSPLFGRPNAQGRRFPEVFVLMPFLPGLKPVYDDHIHKVTASLSLTAKRADDIFTSGSVMTDIWEAICAACIIVADCTGRNPNVFYEAGLAHTVGKPVVLLTQNKDDIPFDLRHIRYIDYEFTPRGMAVFEERLLKTLIDELGINSEKQSA